MAEENQIKHTVSQPPQHVAIIMDGNRRWAREQGKTSVQGHQYVVDKVIEPLVDRCIELQIPNLTLWAFSTENWSRDKEELKGLMGIFRYGLNKKTDKLHKKGVRIQILGEIDKFPKDIAEISHQWVEKTKDNTTITVTFALNYGGRDEITRAVNRWLNQQSEVANLQITEEDIENNLDTVRLPDPDLIIRPGGQLRTSGFMPWQSVYAELYFTDVLMPDFDVAQFDQALADFESRHRRFGK